MNRQHFLRILQTLCIAALLVSSLAAQQLEADIQHLAQDDLEGRQIGTRGEVLAAAYIAQRFQALGLQPAGEINTYYQLFTGVPMTNPHETEGAEEAEPLSGRNVVALLDQGADQTIVIGAHYDHLGYGGWGSLHTGEGAVHNGADDNASGTAGLIYLAERLKDDKEFNYLFIAFSGEEYGLWGSNYWVKNPTYPLEKIHYMVNMDMIGRLDPDRGLAIHGTGTAEEWSDLLDAAVAGIAPVKAVRYESGIGPSDFTSFYNAGIPVLSFFTGQHEDYHKPTDDVERLNLPGTYQVLHLIEDIIDRSASIEELHYAETEAPPSETPRFTVTLGVIPDYLYDEEGMRIDGVKPDRPAAKAGIQKGDVVIGMGDIEVSDIYKYMEALSSYSEGDSAQIKVRRGEDILDFTVQF